MIKQADPVDILPPIAPAKARKSRGSSRPSLRLLVFVVSVLGLTGATTALASDEIEIERANWSSDRDQLTVRGKDAPNGATVTIRYGKKEDNGAVIGTTRADSDGDWNYRIINPNPVPCHVTAQAGGEDDDKDVRRAPNNCSDDGGTPPPQPVCDIAVNPLALSFGNVTLGSSPTLSTAVRNSGAAACNVSLMLTGSSDFSVTSNTSFSVSPGTSQTVSVSYAPGAVGTDAGNLAVNSNDPDTAAANVTLSGNGVDQQAQCVPATQSLSINSTSQDGCPQQLVPEEQMVLNGDYKVLAINDLGMHCGDLDTRISSILPPFQVLLGQVIQRGSTPTLNPPGVTLEYSAASNPNDPILGKDPSVVQRGLMADGSTYKTNFWDVARSAYDPFYPAGILPLFYPEGTDIRDIGLPVPNPEELYIGADGVVNSGDEQLHAVQHAMPGLTNPYFINDPQAVQERFGDKPFFVNFPFGYVAADVNWYEGAGIPFAAYDDFGRENAYPLVRVEARQNNATVATVDTVLPISGEASCTNCHSDPADVQNSRTSQPTDSLVKAGLPVATSLDDPNPALPMDVSVEYAADINILRLHDLKHGANYVDPFGTATLCDVTANGGNGDTNCLINKALVQGEAVVCQVCHYTPALDLAQVGPAAGADGNGRNQLAHSSNSNVMHSHHGGLGNLFPPMPAPIQNAQGVITNQAERLAVLEDTCYQCHPGTNVQCLRGAMFNGGMLCNDCHGDMEQVGNDFSAGVSPDNPGAFVLGGDFYDPGPMNRVVAPAIPARQPTTWRERPTPSPTPATSTATWTAFVCARPTGAVIPRPRRSFRATSVSQSRPYRPCMQTPTVQRSATRALATHSCIGSARATAA
jgi:hypothetical protein